MGKIKLITDSGSDISQKQAAELGIKVIPLTYTFDGETYYKDGVDLPIEEFYSRLRSNKVPPKTSQIPPTLFIDAYNETFDEGYDTIIVVTISSNASGVYQNASLAANEVTDERGGDITVIDSQGFTVLYGKAVMEAARMANEGKEKEEIVCFIKEAINSMKAYFIVENLEHLKKGGRINAATLVVATMLDIKPVLVVEGGLVAQKEKIRGSKKLYKKLIAIAEQEGYNGENVIIAHTALGDKVTEFKNEILEKYPNVKVSEWVLGSTIACHAGPELIAIVYSDKFNW